jgi:hypothetical protein
MRGEQAALIVQAEEHVSLAIRELRTAWMRCDSLQHKTGDPAVKEGMQRIMDKLDFHISAIQDAEYEEDFHSYWDS